MYFTNTFDSRDVVIAHPGPFRADGVLVLDGDRKLVAEASDHQTARALAALLSEYLHRTTAPLIAWSPSDGEDE